MLMDVVGQRVPFGSDNGRAILGRKLVSLHNVRRESTRSKVLRRFEGSLTWCSQTEYSVLSIPSIVETGNRTEIQSLAGL